MFPTSGMMFRVTITFYIFRFRFRPYQNPVSEQYMYDFRPLILIKVLNGLVPRIDMCTT